MLEIWFKESNTKKLKEKYLQENKVMSVRGGKEYKITAEAKKFLKKEKIKKPGFFKRVFCWKSKERSSESNERDIQPKQVNKGKKRIRTANGINKWVIFRIL